MNIDIIKEAYVEQCENVFALASNYQKNHNNPIIDEYINTLNDLNHLIRKANDAEDINKITSKIDIVIKLIEVIIHE